MHCQYSPHLVYYSHAYHKIMKSQNEEQKDQNGYILIMVYFVSVLITGCIYSFVTSNFLTGSHPSDFTATRCLVGAISEYIFMTFNMILLNIILLLRIYHIFKGSVYAYKSWIYCSVFVLIMCFSIPMMIFIVNLYETVSFTFVYDSVTEIGFCGPDNLVMGKTNTLSISITIGIILQPIIAVVLWFMFVKGLWILNMQMMHNFVQDQIKMSQIDAKHVKQDSGQVMDKKVGINNILDDWEKRITIAETIRPEIKEWLDPII